MNIVIVRRISQAFFLVLFLWFCLVSTVGDRIWQIRGWPVGLFLELDPLVALGNMLATHTLYKNLLWALLTIILTFIFGRFFCGFLCPFGTLHHFVGYLGFRKRPIKVLQAANRYRKAHIIKYIILVVLLAMAIVPGSDKSLQIGLLDPIPLFQRSVNLTLLPMSDVINIHSTLGRFYQGAWIILLVFMLAVLLNLLYPRFYCRIICPLGALLAVFSRISIFRIGKKSLQCKSCSRCDYYCVGGCEPAQKIYIEECLLCFNCKDVCPKDIMGYQTEKSRAGEITGFGMSRKSFFISAVGGLLLMPSIRLAAETARNFFHKTIRPPGALDEGDFLKRCIKCGQCMRICPTNIIQPGELHHGLENLWTPQLNFRIGTSGCQFNCVACGQICPTSAIRPITLDEKHGRGNFKDQGIIRIGTAFFNRGRCLPWAMNKPCIVCQENCPVSPKAIYTDEHFEVVRNGLIRVREQISGDLKLDKAEFRPGEIATGDYYLTLNGKRHKIIANARDEISILPGELGHVATGSLAEVQVRLQRPFMDIEKCNGCGICEHECPVNGLPAVTISAEGESRNRSHAILLKGRLK